jgi:formylglycine-generating enzyme required for sulfatase activity
MKKGNPALAILLVLPLAVRAPLAAQTAAVNMVRINGGTFAMGSPGSEQEKYYYPDERHNDELQHRVTVSSFYMGKYAVTQREWWEVMGYNPSKFSGDNLPVEKVSWYEAVEYCNKRSWNEGLTPAYTINGTNVTWNRNANGYRLPTEAEWEYACRAGTTTPYYTGESVDSAGWYRNNSGDKPHPVGQKQPNAWGLYDMSGNVYEWCWDWLGEYPREAQTDPVGPVGVETSSARVFRGGSFSNDALVLRSAWRIGSSPDARSSGLGFRVARSAF